MDPQAVRMQRLRETNLGNQLAWKLQSAPLVPLNAEGPSPGTTVPPPSDEGSPGPTTTTTIPEGPPTGTTTPAPADSSRPTVRDQVDQVLGDDASEAQRDNAYRLVEGYVDEVGGLGDDGINLTAIPDRAVDLLQDAGIPTIRDDNANHLVETPVEEVFSADARRGIIGREYQGADSDRLRDLTIQLLEYDADGLADPANAEDIDELVSEIADVRGVPVTTLRADFDVYQELLAVQEHNIANEDIPKFDAHDRLLVERPEHFGSTEALRYGDVVGQVYGIDPIFGAALNPSGGLPGPGQQILDFVDEDEPILYHSAYHDAIGHLRLGHNLETEVTYDYVGAEPDNVFEVVDGILPSEIADLYGPDQGTLTGQATGIAWWTHALSVHRASNATEGPPTGTTTIPPSTTTPPAGAPPTTIPPAGPPTGTTIPS